MAFVTNYNVDPRILGAYASAGAAAQAERQNLQRSIDNSMQAAQVSGQFAQHNRDREAATADRQLNRQAELAEAGMRQATAAAQIEADLYKQERQADAAIEIEQQRQAGQRARNYDEMVQRGLRDGTLYYSPQQRQQLAEKQRSVAAIYADPSIAPEHQHAMADKAFRSMRAIVPMVRGEDERPTPLHQQAAENITIATSDGRVVPIGQLGRGLQDGDVIVTGSIRNGAMTFNARPFTAKKAEADPYADFSSPIKLNRIRGEIARDIKAELDVQHDNELADWEMKKEAHKLSSPDEPFTVPRPRKRLPTPQEIDIRLYEISGGVAGAAPTQPAWPRSAMFGGYSEVPQQQPDRPAQSEPLPPKQSEPLPPKQSKPLPPKTERQKPGVMKEWLASQGLVDTSGATDRDWAVMPQDAAQQAVNVIIANQPVQVISEAEALTKPIGTVVILNGRKFVVGE